MGLWRLLTGQFTPPLGGEHGESHRFQVAGVTFDGRQSAIENISKGDHLKIVRETRNRFDANAIRLVSASGTIGYVPRDLAAELAPALDMGASAKSEVSSVSKGGNGYPRDVWAYLWIRP